MMLLISPLPVKTGEGTLDYLAVCQSVCLSVCPSVRQSVHSVSVHSVFRTVLSRPLRYWLEIWYMDLSWHNTDQVRLWLRLTYFYMTYCPLLKLVPTDENRGGDYRFPRRLSVCLSVCLSVSPSVSPLGVRPLGFPNCSQSSFAILAWNLVYGFVLT